jgi:hypothetical protein
MRQQLRRDPGHRLPFACRESDEHRIEPGEGRRDETLLSITRSGLFSALSARH